MEACPYAIRQGGAAAIRCLKMMEAGKPPYCAFQQFCSKGGRYEHTGGAGGCKMRTEAERH